MEIENARQQENTMKALAFYGQKCLGEYFAKWRTYAKLMIAKRQLRDLQTQKEKSKAKVKTFLKNIDSFENERNTESRLQNHRKLKPLVGTVPTNTVTCSTGNFLSSIIQAICLSSVEYEYYYLYNVINLEHYLFSFRLMARM